MPTECSGKAIDVDSFALLPILGSLLSVTGLLIVVRTTPMNLVVRRQNV